MAISVKKTKQVPAAAFRMTAEVELGNNGDNSTSAPIKIMARSGGPVVSPYFDYPIYHDFSSMSHKPRILLDYRHDDDDPVGYLNHFDTSTNDLVVSGAITSIEPGDTADKVMKRNRVGQPLEASIDFRGPADFEELGVNQTARVNGRDIVGPALIVKRWMLRAVALCPHGMDPATYAQFSDSDTITVSFSKYTPDQSTPNGDSQMSEETTPVEADAAVETAVDNDKTEVKVDETKPAEGEEKPVEADETEGDAKPVEVVQQQTEVQGETQAPSQGELFLQKFGDSLGGKWFAQGKTLEQATQLFIDNLKAENAELKQRMQALRGAESPVSFSESPDARKTDHPANVGELSHLTDTQKAFTNEFELPTTKTK